MKTYLDTKIKFDCCGCEACKEICPKNCISMREDEEHFRYPEIEKNKCIDCGLCRTVCPLSENNKSVFNEQADEVYAAVGNDESVVISSSSGGAFTYIVQSFCDENFAVFGAENSNKLKLRHTFAETLEDAKKFRKSKYYQSSINSSFKQAKEKLDSGMKVLFSGTPCQIAGLKCFLNKDYDNLLTVDLVCHGVPSEWLFEKYIRELEENFGESIKEFSFRNKIKKEKNNWNSRSVKIEFESGKEIVKTVDECSYLEGFHRALFYRPSCEKCHFACTERCGDITVADYWEIHKKYPDLNALKGVSMVILNTEKGKNLKDKIARNMDMRVTDFAFAKQCNEQLHEPVHVNAKRRKKFFSLIDRTSFDKAVKKSLQKPLPVRLLFKITGEDFKQKVKKILKG